MKRTLLVALMLVVCTTGANAQLTYDAAVGFDIPTGDFGDGYNAGFGIGADVLYSLPSMPNLGLGGRLAWDRFGVDDGMAGVDGGSMSMIEVLPTARYTFTPYDAQFGYFAQAGVGMYFWNSTIETAAGDIEDDGSDFGFCIGAGVTGRFSDTMTFMAMPMYHIINTEDESTNFFAINFGVLFQ